MHNVGGMIGGDSPLSPQGEKYAAALPALVLENVGDHPLQVRSQTFCRLASGRAVADCLSTHFCCKTRSGQVHCR